MVFFGSLLGALIVIAWIAAFVDIARHRHERTFAATSAWILVVLILPVVGTLTYFIVTRMQSALNDDDGPGGAEPQEPSQFGDDLATGAARDPDATRFGR